METVYAQALWSMIEKGSNPERAVHALNDLLIKHGRQALLPRIARAFLRVARREIARSGYTLYVASEHAAARSKTAAKKALEEMGALHGEFDVRTDDTLIGGWRLEGAGNLVDASYKKQLLTLYNRVTAQ